MQGYLLLIKWTGEEAKNIGETFDRVKAAQVLAEQFGAVMHTCRWIQGGYDFMALVDAPNDEVVAALVLAASKSGAIRTETHRAFDETEMRRIVEKVN